LKKKGNNPLRRTLGHRDKATRALARPFGFLAVAVALLPSPAFDQPQSAPVVSGSGHYSYREASRDGTGKFYHGREIARVMGHTGAGWLDRPGRAREERTDLVVRNLPLRGRDVVADIGAGTGYFALAIAERIPDGTVLAVDIQLEMLDMIRARRDSQGIRNVRAVLGSERDPGLTPNSVDLILLVDAYHEFSFPAEMAAAMVLALKPAGYLILVEYRGEDPAVPIKPLHKMTEFQVRREMTAAGLAWQETADFLPRQHFLIFRKPTYE
jgi:SAM-dependent methyltransferase